LPARPACRLQSANNSAFRLPRVTAADQRRFRQRGGKRGSRLCVGERQDTAAHLRKVVLVLTCPLARRGKDGAHSIGSSARPSATERSPFRLARVDIPTWAALFAHRQFTLCRWAKADLGYISVKPVPRVQTAVNLSREDSLNPHRTSRGDQISEGTGKRAKLRSARRNTAVQTRPPPPWQQQSHAASSAACDASDIRARFMARLIDDPPPDARPLHPPKPGPRIHT